MSWASLIPVELAHRSRGLLLSYRRLGMMVERSTPFTNWYRWPTPGPVCIACDECDGVEYIVSVHTSICIARHTSCSVCLLRFYISFFAFNVLQTSSQEVRPEPWWWITGFHGMRMWCDDLWDYIRDLFWDFYIVYIIFITTFEMFTLRLMLLMFSFHSCLAGSWNIICMWLNVGVVSVTPIGYKSELLQVILFFFGCPKCRAIMPKFF